MTCLSYIAAHYLEDGILKISYTMEDEGELIVASIDYFSDYNMKDCLGRTINYRIQDSDLPSKRYWSGEIKGELVETLLGSRIKVERIIEDAWKNSNLK